MYKLTTRSYYLGFYCFYFQRLLYSVLIFINKITFNKSICSGHHCLSLSVAFLITNSLMLILLKEYATQSIISIKLLQLNYVTFKTYLFIRSMHFFKSTTELFVLLLISLCQSSQIHTQNENDFSQFKISIKKICLEM